MLVRDELCTRPAVLHGGAVMAFADTLGAAATVLNLREGKGTTTIESKTNFVGPAPVGTTVIGETMPIHRGRRTQVWTTRITTAEGKLVAVVTRPKMWFRTPRRGATWWGWPPDADGAVARLVGAAMVSAAAPARRRSGACRHRQWSVRRS